MEDRYSESQFPVEEQKYRKWIIFLSVAIPLVVAALFVVKIPGAKPLSFLPRIYAGINALTALVLIGALFAVKFRKFRWHEYLMKTAIGLSVVFLGMYIAYHMTSDPTTFGGTGTAKYVYFFVLISHILLSIVVIPLVLISFVRAFSRQFVRHKRIARFTFPIWLYVAVSGVIVYLMISPYYTF